MTRKGTPHHLFIHWNLMTLSLDDPHSFIHWNLMNLSVFLVLLCRNSWIFRESVQGIKETKYLHAFCLLNSQEASLRNRIHTKTVLSFVVSCPHWVSFPLEAVRKKPRSVASQCCITDSEFIKNIQTRSHHIRNALFIITSLDVWCTRFTSFAW